MTAEQLEELLGRTTPDWCVYSELDVGLMPSLFAGKIGVSGFGPLEPLQGYDLMLAALAPTLARRVIAAEILVEALDNYIAVISEPNHTATSQMMSKHHLHNARTAYREALK